MSIPMEHANPIIVFNENTIKRINALILFFMPEFIVTAVKLKNSATSRIIQL